MINWMRSPKVANVAKYVDRYWFLEKKHSGDSHNYPKLNPHAEGHLILAPPLQPYQYETESSPVNGKGSHWLFPHSQTIQLDHSHPFIYLGIKFHIGALYSLAIVPNQPVLEQVIDVNVAVLLKSDSFNDASILAKAKSQPDVCRDILDEQLLPWLLSGLEDRHALLTRKALPLLAHKPVAKLGELLHCSQRTLERSFARVTGLTLKQCQSMNRLEAILEFLYLRKPQDIDWVQIADQFGFSDQPHLIRYLKKSIGVTPSNYAKQRDFTIDIYGGVDSQK